MSQTIEQEINAFWRATDKRRREILEGVDDAPPEEQAAFLVLEEIHDAMTLVLGQKIGRVYAVRNPWEHPDLLLHFAGIIRRCFDRAKEKA